jgi:hypothetical protein
MTEGGKKDVFHLFSTMLPHLSLLTFKLGFEFLRFKKEAKKGSRIFHEELIKQGINETQAAKLTELYYKGSDILHHLLRPFQ